MTEKFNRLFRQNTELLERAAGKVCYAIPPEEAAKIAAINARLSSGTKKETPIYSFDPQERPTVEQLKWMFAGQNPNTSLSRALVKVSERQGMVQSFPLLPTAYVEDYPERYFPLPELKRSLPPEEQISPPLIIPGALPWDPALGLRIEQINSSPDAIAEIEQVIKLKRRSDLGLANFTTGKRATVGRIQVDQLFAPAPKSFPPGDPLLVTLLPGALKEKDRLLWNRNLAISTRTGLEAMTDFFVYQALTRQPEIIHDQNATKKFHSAAFRQAQNAQKLALASGDGAVISSLYETTDLRLSWKEASFLSYALSHMFDSTALNNINTLFSRADLAGVFRQEKGWANL